MTHSEEYLRAYAQEQHEAQEALDAAARELKKIDRSEADVALFAARAERLAAYETYSNTFTVPQNYGSAIDRLSAVANQTPVPAPVAEDEETGEEMGEQDADVGSEMPAAKDDAIAEGGDEQADAENAED